MGILTLLGVLCFIFPEWLTTADLRGSLYSFTFARNLLWFGIVVVFTMGIVSSRIHFLEALVTRSVVILPLIDMLMGTLRLPDKMWPDAYGVFGRPPPQGYLAQLAHPFHFGNTVKRDGF